ncbi:SDR family oxidoreductase [Halobacteriovorax marinus]|uniref:SDR family oxidoreductase n=1 Tax=Halobacteriovorax marinus TaxID=97084 RepID=UPI0002EA01E2|nr:SDR family oxidoreductase [Halobacteriovorax marinus]
MSELTKISKLLSQKEKTWLVTGCAGFIGSNLIEFLLSSGQRVVGLDNFSTGRRENLSDVEKSVGSEAWSCFSFIEGDILDLETCKRAVAGVDYVLHQAALGSVPRSIKDPLNSHNSNVNGQLNMLWASKLSGVKSFVFASSSSVYGDHPALPKVESEIGMQLSPYAVTKHVNELYANVFFKNYGLNTVGIRYFNVFGKRQDPNSVYAAVIPRWVKAMLSDEKVVIFGDGETSRDFCYIDNVVQMNILSALSQEKAVFGTVFNCACHDRTTLNKLFFLIKRELVKYDSSLADIDVGYGDFRDGDIRHSHADISKAADLLGYSPSHMVEEGLIESIDWYYKNLK